MYSLLYATQGPYFVLNALNKLPSSLLKNLTYIVAGRRDDCGAMCIEFYTLLEKRSQELKLTKNVIFMPEKLTEEGWTDLWLAADIAMLIYAEDLNPHPATYYEALSSGAIPITTPFAAALAEERGRSTVLTWDRDPDVVAAAIKSVLMSDALSVEKMREDAWKAVQDSRWKEFGYTLSKKVILPTIRKGRGALYNNDR